MAMTAMTAMRPEAPDRSRTQGSFQLFISCLNHLWHPNFIEITRINMISCCNQLTSSNHSEMALNIFKIV
jgi:hypothetical protein